jgi:hypothetical protein
VTIGGAPAAVQFSGLAPGFVGLYQVNAQVPPWAATGPAVPVVISIGAVASNTVTMAVERLSGRRFSYRIQHAPRDSMRKACGATTLSASGVARLKTWSGTTCPGLPRARSANGFFANTN